MPQLESESFSLPFSLQESTLMKTRILLSQIALLGAIGCGGPAPVMDSVPDVSDTVETSDPNATYVSLKVPNMH